MLVRAEDWRKICEDYVRRNIEISEEQVKTLVDAALCADIRGVASHGTVRLPAYIKRAKAGLINLNPNIKVSNDEKSLVHIDGDNGLGQIISDFAMNKAIEKARHHGVCSISICNSNHMGMLSYYAMKATRENMIAYIMCNTPVVVAPVGGIEPAVGTNPMCWAFPGKDFPVVMDMAISPARGKIRNFLAKGQPVPEGWAIDKEGKPTTDAAAAMDGCLLPVGGVKGYGMGIVVEAFTGILSGAKYGKNVTQPFDDFEHVPDIGIYMQVLDVKQLMSVPEFIERVEDYIQMIKSTRKEEGASNIYVPGEIEYGRERKVAQDGLVIDEKTYNDMLA